MEEMNFREVLNSWLEKSYVAKVANIERIPCVLSFCVLSLARYVRMSRLNDCFEQKKVTALASNEQQKKLAVRVV